MGLCNDSVDRSRAKRKQHYISNFLASTSTHMFGSGDSESLRIVAPNQADTVLATKPIVTVNTPLEDYIDIYSTHAILQRKRNKQSDEALACSALTTENDSSCLCVPKGKPDACSRAASRKKKTGGNVPTTHRDTRVSDESMVTVYTFSREESRLPVVEDPIEAPKRGIIFYAADLVQRKMNATTRPRILTWLSADESIHPKKYADWLKNLRGKKYAEWLDGPLVGTKDLTLRGALIHDKAYGSEVSAFVGLLVPPDGLGWTQVPSPPHNGVRIDSDALASAISMERNARIEQMIASLRLSLEREPSGEEVTAGSKNWETVHVSADARESLRGQDELSFEHYVHVDNVYFVPLKITAGSLRESERGPGFAAYVVTMQ